MKRALALTVVVAAVLGFASAADAGTLSLISTNSSGVAQNTFAPGETIVLRVDGDAQGGLSTGIYGRLLWNPAGGTAFAATQTQMLQTVSPLLVGAGFGDVTNQIEPSGQAVQPIDQHFVGTVSLIMGTTMGSYTVGWSFDSNFFGISFYSAATAAPPSHTFTLIPEPATAALIGLGLLGMGLGARARARAASATGR